MTKPSLRLVVTAISLSLLAACGGGSGSDSPTTSIQKPDIAVSVPDSTSSTDARAPIDTVAPPSVTPPTSPDISFSRKEASRFLARATFGPRMAEIDALAASDANAWLSKQFATPQTLHRKYIDQWLADKAVSGSGASSQGMYESFWLQAVRGEDQLRQRMAFALSQIFVLSMQNDAVYPMVRGSASYYDMLGQHAFGNFRNLLEGVALHPMMGLYLSHLRNQKESGTRVPDENFAREVMQLFTIGLVQLNADGSVKLSGGKPIDTYSHDDVMGLAKVFTGWSWAGPDQSGNRFYGAVADPDRDWKPMQNYPAFHSTSEKRFLGQSVSGSDARAELKLALDTLFNHPNAGPFFGRQLIQRLVTSNPSPAYIARVSAAFANNGRGVRGDMQAIIRAVLLDPEALAPAGSTLRTGKLSEPLLRLAGWMRAFDAKATSGRYRIYYLHEALGGLGQNPLFASSVFNFYRPAYVPPNSALADANLVAPELQITSEPSVTGYLNFMQDAINIGVGENQEVKANYTPELALSSNASALLDRIDLLLLRGAMSSRLRGHILAAVNSVTLPAANGSNAAQLATAQANRVKLAIFLTMASPEYQVQK